MANKKVVKERVVEKPDTVVVDNEPRSNAGVIAAIVILVILLLLFFGRGMFGGGGGGSSVNVTAPSSGH
jgi:hypothetical protein